MDVNANGQEGNAEHHPQKKGKFSAEESAVVRKAIEDYCAERRIEVSRLCSECDHKAELKGAWMEIGKCLPNRRVQSIYRHGIRQLHPFKRGPWSTEELQTLVGLVARLGKQWAMIQTKLNRSADACRDKFREDCGEYTKGRWKDNETEQLKRMVRQYLKLDPTTSVLEIVSVIESKGISLPWTAFSNRMQKKSRLSCLKRWEKIVHAALKGKKIEQVANPYLSREKSRIAPNSGSNAASHNDTQTRSAKTGRSRSTSRVRTSQVASSADAPRIHVPPEARRAPTAGAASAAMLEADVQTAFTNIQRKSTGSAQNVGTVIHFRNVFSSGASRDITANPAFSGTVVTAAANTPSQDLPTQAESDESATNDIYLLGEIINLGIDDLNAVDWDMVDLPDAKDRWTLLVEEWKAQNPGNQVLWNKKLPVMARDILDHKQMVERAAKTVEAVNLPNPETLHNPSV